MSLTHHAYQERMWGPFPALRKELEQKDMPNEHYGLTSADDDDFEFMRRLVEVANLVCANKEHIQEIVTSGCIDAVCEDLNRLEFFLKEASTHLKYKADKISVFSRELVHRQEK